MPSQTQFSVNGQSVIDGRLWLPRVGRWTADLILPDASPLAAGQAVTLTPEAGTPLVGTVLAAGVFEGVTSLSVVGGGGGLGKSPAVKTLRDLPLSSVLSDTLAAVGERLSDASDAGLLAYRVRSYVRRAQTAAATLHYWAGDRGAVWRALPDGSVWFGVDAFAPAPRFDFALMGSSPSASLEVVATEALYYLPGSTFNGRKVSAVTYQLGASVRAEVLYEWP